MTVIRTSEIRPTRYPAGELSFPGYEDVTRVFLDDPSPEGVVAAVQLSHQSTQDAVELFVPYFPAARADKPGNFDIRPLAAMLAAGRFSKVMILDPHSETSRQVIQDAFANSPGAPEVMFREAVGIIAAEVDRNDYTAVVAPDKGAVQRAGAVASVLDLPLVTASKNRDQATGYITDYSLDDTAVDLSSVLVIDDICDGGMTFKILRKCLPGDADLFVSHGVFSGKAQDNLAGYRTVITTDSLMSAWTSGIPNVEIIPLA